MEDVIVTPYRDQVTDWFHRLEQAMSTSEIDDVVSLFHHESYWRDMLAMTWKLQTLCGADAIARSLGPAWTAVQVSNVEVDRSDNPPRLVTRVGTEAIEVFFTFETGIGRGRGIVRLCPDAEDGGRLKVWTLLTTLEELKGYEEKIGRNRPTGRDFSRDFRGPNWLDQRLQATAYEARDPAVLVVGGGQAGLATAARLTQLGVDTLIVDKHERIGDNWRKRYHALTLHNQVQVNHLPYMPFPPTWPTYIPKDKLANWFEAYVEAMELNYWASTVFLGATYDEKSQQWTARLRHRNGSERTMHPRHIVMATGVSGIANWPDIPTLKNFAGHVQHSSEYQDGEAWTGKSAIVIGTGNSGHDIAQDLYTSGADVTLVQRSPTLIVNIEPSAQLPYALYDEGPSLEDCDLLAISMPTPLVKRAHVNFTASARQLDQPLLDGLQKIGFKLDFGEDATGWQFKYLTRGGGYYFNVGCSDMLVEGKIKLLQYDQIEAFTEAGARLKSGEIVPVDLMVLATGYKPQEVLIKKLFGKAVADRVGPIWGFGDQLELRNMYCRTAQPGLWFIAGSFAQCRINSKYLGLQIKACEAGLMAAEWGRR